MDKIIESIEKCTVNKNVLFLPKEMLPNYPQVKKTLVDAGGTYKKNTFVFKTDAQPIIDRICGGEKVNDKKKYQFFETPEDLAYKMALFAELFDGCRLLEPGAGHGALIDAAWKLCPDIQINACELSPENRKVLIKKYNQKHNFMLYTEPDFIKKDFPCFFDRIIANPPFTKNQDIKHFMKMYRLLNEKGILVCILSNHWTFATDSISVAFRDFINEKEKVDQSSVYVETLEPGTFKESGTNVATTLVKIVKSLRDPKF